MMLLAAAGVMYSCSLETDDFPDTDLQFAQLRIAQDVAGSCDGDCIEPGTEIYYPFSDMATGSAGPNTKSVSYTAYNTETDFVVEVTYVTSGRSNAEATISIDIDGDEVEYTGVISGSKVSHTVPLAEDWAGCDEVAFSILQEGLGQPITFSERYALIPVCLGLGFEDVTSITGKTWMDRNLGASRVAESSTDSEAYGDLYQWGRAADGHQTIHRFDGDGKTTSGTTTTLSSTDQPGHGDFIIGSTDWRATQNDNLWQGVDGVNNPCPSGYRLPTQAEWGEERATWSSNNAAGAFESPLKLTVAGVRTSSGLFQEGGNIGYYWSSTVFGAGNLLRDMRILSSSATEGFNFPASGLSVRCIKD
ncbi:fibrobacter succinogenes major paralogous domain-containing protein [Pleomorphovibrio marinus]|uniref:FISUMP domain-containing protein n=1 Tax=Pleomorphovibrio marinus TaxID=2164132 RepID=UPI0013004F57|nr:FISUMP domain-containing protein [Pleomorphovibrio marinus]